MGCGRAQGCCGGTGLSVSLALLDVAQGYLSTSLRSVVSHARLGAPPCIWPRDARNVALPPFRSPS